MSKISTSQSSQEVTPEIIKVIAESDPLAVVGAGGSTNQSSKDKYATFGARFWASVIDNFLLGIVGFVIFVAGLVIFSTSYTPEASEEIIRICQAPAALENIEQCRDLSNNFSRSFLTSIAIALLVSSCYRIFWSMSRWQGTIGKRAMKLIIVDERGLKINWLQAFARESFGIVLLITSFAAVYWPNIFTFIPIIMIAILQSGLRVLWAKNKQATQDSIAQTFVIQT